MLDGDRYFLEVRMAKLKSIIFVAGVMLLILAAAVGCFSIKYLVAILPADSYEDKGVYTFYPIRCCSSRCRIQMQAYMTAA